MFPPTGDEDGVPVPSNYPVWMSPVIRGNVGAQGRGPFPQTEWTSPCIIKAHLSAICSNHSNNKSCFNRSMSCGSDIQGNQ